MGGKFERFLELITGGSDRAEPLPPAEDTRDDFKQSDLSELPQTPVDPLEPQMEEHHVGPSPIHGTRHEPDMIKGTRIEHHR